MRTMSNDGEKTYSDEQLQSVKRVYDAILGFLRDFYLPDGLTGSLWDDYRSEYPGPASRALEAVIRESVEKRIREVEFVYQQEGFYLRGTEVYAELGACIDKEVRAAISEKLSYAYRYGQDPESEWPSPWADYSKALTRINGILGIS